MPTATKKKSNTANTVPLAANTATPLPEKEKADENLVKEGITNRATVTEVTPDVAIAKLADGRKIIELNLPPKEGKRYPKVFRGIIPWEQARASGMKFLGAWQFSETSAIPHCEEMLDSDVYLVGGYFILPTVDEKNDYYFITFDEQFLLYKASLIIRCLGYSLDTETKPIFEFISNEEQVKTEMKKQFQVQELVNGWVLNQRAAGKQPTEEQIAKKSEQFKAVMFD